MSDRWASILPEDAVVMGNTWHRSIRRTDWQVHIRLSRLSIHRFGLCRKDMCSDTLTLKPPTDDTIKTHVGCITPTFQRKPLSHGRLHTAFRAERSNRKTAVGFRLERNVAPHQLIPFIFTRLWAKSARLSRHLDSTFFGLFALKKKDQNDCRRTGRPFMLHV